jgi:hypothetical protein
MNIILNVFINSWGGVRLSPLGTSATVPAPDDRWEWSSRWNENCQGKLKYSEKICLSATLQTTDRTLDGTGAAWAMARRSLHFYYSSKVLQLHTFEKAMSASTYYECALHSDDETWKHTVSLRSFLPSAQGKFYLCCCESAGTHSEVSAVSVCGAVELQASQQQYISRWVENTGLTSVVRGENHTKVRDAVIFSEQDSDNMNRKYIIIKISLKHSGVRSSVVGSALCYKQEWCRFDSRWGHWIFQLI